MNEIIEILIILIPAYIANSSPVLFGGGTAMDMGKNFLDNERIFGEGKTIRGFFAGAFCGIFAGALVTIFHQTTFFSDPKTQFLGFVVLAVGSISGDAVGSFIKRRLKFESGKQFWLDTIFFIIFAMIVVSPIIKPEFYKIENIVFIVGLTAVLHPLTNFIANKIGLKRVPW
jgi:CDP-2,3-bis-(O-geranylgeranyl)-sn-glycerol synthase